MSNARESWNNKSHPSVGGWTREKFIRGAHTKNPNEVYYVYYSPSGKRFRSIKNVNRYIEANKSSVNNINVVFATVSDTTVNITINDNGSVHIRWQDIV
jgi:hypothetical protein|tara:strand:+ start:1466 stop:1762 length:297 start_codon:yes stop_codon:yes gene_type:complete